MRSLLFLFLITISSLCFGQSNELTPSITVTSEASKIIEPNIGYLLFEVTTVNDDIVQAKTLNDQKITEVLAFLKKQKFDSRDIRTISVSLSDFTEYPPNPELRKKQFRAFQQFRITFQDLQKYEHVTSELIRKGAARINGLQLSHTELETFKTELLNEALEKARTKSDSMANKLNAKTGKVLQIFDEKSLPASQPFYDGQLHEAPSIRGTNASPLAPGSLTISTRVRVVFALN